MSRSLLCSFFTDKRRTRYKDDEPSDDYDDNSAPEPYRDASERGASPEQGASPEPLIPKDLPSRGGAPESFDADLEMGGEEDMMLEHRDIMDGTPAFLPHFHLISPIFRVLTLRSAPQTKTPA